MDIVDILNDTRGRIANELCDSMTGRNNAIMGISDTRAFIAAMDQTIADHQQRLAIIDATIEMHGGTPDTSGTPTPSDPLPDPLPPTAPPADPGNGGDNGGDPPPADPGDGGDPPPDPGA